jgi:hypothetical protein
MATLPDDCFAHAAPALGIDAAQAAGLRVINVPRLAVAPLLDLGQWVVPSWARAPSYVLDHLSFPFVVSTARLERELGFTAAHTSAQALKEMLGTRRRPTGVL